MSDYKVTDTELTAIADAIRAKTGGSDTLEFPTEFVSEIGSISGGGGSKTLLWENENALSTIASSITLNEAFSNYDFLVFIFGYDNNVNVRSSQIVSCDTLTDLLSSGSFYFLREADCAWNFTVTSDTVLTRYSALYLSPKAVYGIKM